MDRIDLIKMNMLHILTGGHNMPKHDLVYSCTELVDMLELTTDNDFKGMELSEFNPTIILINEMVSLIQKEEYDTCIELLKNKLIGAEKYELLINLKL